jgi:hypothetical protein
MTKSDPLKTALDELRMLMLGTQVLLGVEFSLLFQSKFEGLDPMAHVSAGLALSLLIITIAFLIAPACRHRLGERGQRTTRMLHIANKYANLALLPFSLSLALNVSIVASRLFAMTWALVVGGVVLMLALGAWYVIGAWIRSQIHPGVPIMAKDSQTPPLSMRIEQMLTEARVILPGAQALLGFQFLAMLNAGFDALDASVRYTHFAALSAIALAMVLLIAPAAMHRIAYSGQENEDFLRLGSKLVTVALVPLAIGLALDFFVALMKLTSSLSLALTGGATALLLLLGLWYAVPFGVFELKRQTGHRRTAA